MPQSVKQTAIFLTGFLVAAAAPAAARTVADFARFARNSHRVDGLHAVPADASVEKRAGRLVATDEGGHLPEDIITRAPDAARLGTRVPAEYEETTCEVGVMTGRALVPKAIGSSYESVTGTTYRDTTPPPIPGNPEQGCITLGVQARRVAPGVYHVDFLPQFSNMTSPCSAPTWETVVTPKSGAEPVVATTATICDERPQVVEEVRLFNLAGAPRDAAFTIVLLSDLPVVPLP